MNRIVKFIILDIFRNRFMPGYTLLLAVLSWGVFSLEDNSSKGMLTLLNLILLNVPLVSVIFSTIYIYNSAEFIELLLSQPIRRRKIWFGVFSGLQISMATAFLAGAGIPLMIYAPDSHGFMLLLTGLIIGAVFVSLAFFCSIYTRDKAKGIGMAIMLWLYFALLFDGMVLFLLFQFSEYPIEGAMMVVSTLSPIDLSRIMVLLQMDVSAMMGYTGAIFREFFGTVTGMSVAFFILLLWIAVPFLISLRKFRTKDL